MVINKSIELLQIIEFYYTEIKTLGLLLLQ